MFPEMLNKKREIKQGLLDIFVQSDWCTVAFNSPSGYPYLVAVNQVVVGDKLYFHCSKAGFKLDCLAHDPRVCVKTVARETVVSEEYTTDFLSAVAFGRAGLVVEPETRRGILIKLMERFSPQHPKTESCAREGVESTVIVEITIEHITGKENKAL